MEVEPEAARDVSPVRDPRRYEILGEHGRGGLGRPNTYDCGTGHRSSSAGAYGAYPFIDFDQRYFGIVARQGSLGSGREGVALARAIAEPARKWATGTCR
ncbi:MAG: hypothetical protein H7138_24395 [Myxococcales bacterium]|nr:hypothetical protein [Myxococcales bacterium]